MKFKSYFCVSNPHGGRIRFESVSREDALEFARGVYRNEQIICEIHEVLR